MGQPKTKKKRADRKLIQTRISGVVDVELQKRLCRLDLTAAAYVKRLIMVDLGLIAAEDR